MIGSIPVVAFPRVTRYSSRYRNLVISQTSRWEVRPKLSFPELLYLDRDRDHTKKAGPNLTFSRVVCFFKNIITYIVKYNDT